MPTISIDEPVDVEVLFSPPAGGSIKVRPRAFTHRGRAIEVENVNFIHRVPAGDHFRWVFSVSNATAAYRLSFDPADLRWHLLDVYTP